MRRDLRRECGAVRCYLSVRRCAMPLFRKSMLMLLLLALVVGGGAFYGM